MTQLNFTHNTPPTTPIEDGFVLATAQGDKYYYTIIQEYYESDGYGFVSMDISTDEESDALYWDSFTDTYEAIRWAQGVENGHNTIPDTI